MENNSNLPSVVEIAAFVKGFNFSSMQGSSQHFVAFASQRGLSLKQCGEIMWAIKDCHSSLATFERFMDKGDAIHEVIFYLAAREGLKTFDDRQVVSLEAIRDFYRHFRGLSNDPASFVEFIIMAHDRLADLLSFDELWQTVDHLRKYLPEGLDICYPEAILEMIDPEDD